MGVGLDATETDVVVERMAYHVAQDAHVQAIKTMKTYQQDKTVMETVTMI